MKGRGRGRAQAEQAGRTEKARKRRATQPGSKSSWSLSRRATHECWQTNCGIGSSCQRPVSISALKDW
eukprot:1142446-Heterocapsa_arctica.AAC.1